MFGNNRRLLAIEARIDGLYKAIRDIRTDLGKFYVPDRVNCAGCATREKQIRSLQNEKHTLIKNHEEKLFRLRARRGKVDLQLLDLAKKIDEKP